MRARSPIECDVESSNLKMLFHNPFGGHIFVIERSEGTDSIHIKIEIPSSTYDQKYRLFKKHPQGSQSIERAREHEGSLETPYVLLSPHTPLTC